METIFTIIILLFSVVIHEVTHGLVADKLGDPTARLAGRLTLNPLKHIDPFGSIILPLMMAILPGGFIFGWAKPVPFNPYHLKHPERDGALIAIAGPLSNFLVAGVFGALVRIGEATAIPLIVQALPLFAAIVWINIILAVFNLVPIPPLDGSKVLFALLPRSADRFKIALEQYGTILLLLFIFFGFSLITPIMKLLYNFFI
ncbi:MAG: site-2 protease family protein [Nanoarchaeota archaeon]|nr:site-2 protease family protein [Nanoarchaeota archaeon]